MTNRIPLKKVVNIHCEGDSEEIYINALVQDKYKGIKPKFKPKLRGTLQKLMNDIEDDISELEPELPVYHFCILDMDTLHRQGLMTKYNEIKTRLCDKSEKLTFIESMPCLEFWFLLHFTYMNRYMANCKDAIAELDKADRLAGYTKNKKYQAQLYPKLRDKTDTAINNAKKSAHQLSLEHKLSYSMMHCFFEKMDDIVK